MILIIFSLLRRRVIVATPCIFLLDFRRFIPFQRRTKSLALQPPYTPSKVLQQFAIHCKPTTTQAAISQIAAALGSLCFEIRRREAPQSAVQLMMHGASTDAVPQPVSITTQTSLLMPAASVDSAVANAPGQRLAQPLPPAAPATTNPPPSSARPQWVPDDRDLLIKSANRPQFTEASGVRIRAFLEYAENFLDMCGRPRDRWARFISWLGANEAEKVRRSHFFSDDVDYTAFKTGLITLF